MKRQSKAIYLLNRRFPVPGPKAAICSLQGTHSYLMAPFLHKFKNKRELNL